MTQLDHREPGFSLPIIDYRLSGSLEASLAHFARLLYNSRAKRKLPETGRFTPAMLEPFLPSIAALSDLFTSERLDLGMQYFNQPTYRTAYALYFFVINFAKIHQAITEALSAVARFPVNKPIRILDLGAGMGAGLFAGISALHRSGIRADYQALAVDANKAVLQDLQALRPLLDCVPPADIHTEVLDLRRSYQSLLREQPFDIIIAANVLNEIGKRDPETQLKSARLLAIYQQLLSNQGILVVVEPAMAPLSKIIGQIHDQFLRAEPNLSILAPCTGNFACPALTTSNWCHTKRVWRRPILATEIDEYLGHDNSFLKYCSFIIAKEPLRPATRPKQGIRQLRATVLSDPMPDKGVIKLLLCFSGSLRRVMIAPRTQAPIRGSHIVILNEPTISAPRSRDTRRYEALQFELVP